MEHVIESQQKAESEFDRQVRIYTKNTLNSNLEVLKRVNPKVWSMVVGTDKPIQHRIDPVVRDGGIKDLQVTYSDGSKLNLSSKKNLSDAELLDIAQVSKLESYVFYGLDVGQCFLTVYLHTESPDPNFPSRKTPIYVVEEDIPNLILFLSLEDLREILESKRVFIFVGENALKDFFQTLLTPGMPPPGRQIFSRVKQSSSAVLTFLLARFNQFCARKGGRLLEKINNYYDARSPEEWQGLFSPAPPRPLRVMGFTSRFTSVLQYCMRDLLTGFDDVGCETKLLIEPDEVKVVLTLDLIEEVWQFKPDLFLLLDHYRFEMMSLSKLPVVSWIQDLLEFTIDDKLPAVDRLNLVFSFSKTWLKNGSFPKSRFKDCRLEFLPVGVNHHIYHKIPDAAKTIDVLYVSHISDPATSLYLYRCDESIQMSISLGEEKILEASDIPPENLKAIYRLTTEYLDRLPLSGLLNTLIEDQAHSELCAHVFGKVNVPNIERNRALLKGMYGNRFNNEVSNLIKLRPILALETLPINLKVYGNNWQKYPQMSKIAMGPIGNGSELNVLMNSAKICIHNSGGTTHHMRSMEIMASGTFMIARRIPREQDNADLRDNFIENEEVVFFDDEEDLKRKVVYYLAHAEERERIAAAAQKKSIAMFGYDMVARNIITSTRELYSDDH